MRKFFSLFTRRWFITLLGVIALSIIVWVLGPLLEFRDQPVLASELSRAVVIAVLFGLWLLRLLAKQFREKGVNAELIEGIVRAKREREPAAGEAEVAQLQGRFEEAIGTLKKTRRGGMFGQQHLYQLPWYMFIGPPGCGKTTALRNSGLHFPLADEGGDGDLRGVGGTRNCDWFFTDEAVLIDTAGRYATQDSHQALDSAEWAGFLALLKKHRRRRPINGVMVTISLTDLLQLSEMERSEHERAIRKRIAELHEHLGVRFPVYVLVTKCDLLEGFIEFFDDLRPEGRRQVWGVTFPESTISAPEHALDSFARDFEALENNLHALLPERLQAESSVEKRALILAFPQQFATLKPVLEPFLSNVFRGSRYETSVLVRGVYFMSGTQEGAPLDRLLGQIAGSLGLSRSAASVSADRARSYFLERLLKDVIFKEAGIAGTNLKLERRRRQLEFASYAGVVLALGLAAAAWVTSYARNSAFVSSVDEQARETQEIVAALAPGLVSPVEALPAMNAARDLWRVSAREEGVPLLMRLGLSQADKLGRQAQESYDRLVRGQFLPRVLLMLENEISRPSTAFEERYESLKTYLMLDDPERFEREDVEIWVTYLFERDLADRISAEMSGDLGGHLRALLDDLESGALAGSIALNQPVVDAARRQLAEVSRAEHAYARLKRLRAFTSLPAFNPIRAAGDDAPLVLARKSGRPLSEGVPGMYTRAGYDTYLKLSLTMAQSLAGERWVLGDQAPSASPAEIKALVDDVGEFYAIEYIEQWEALLNDITVSSFSTLPQAVQAMNVLSNATTSPLVRLVGAVADETALRRPLRGAGKVKEKLDKALDLGKELVEGLRGGDGAGDDGSSQPRGPGARIQAHFQRIVTLSRGAEGQPPAIADLTNVLTELWVQMNGLASAPGDDLLALARNQVKGLIQQLKLKATRERPPVGVWMTEIATHSERVVGAGVQKRLDKGWQSTGLSFCRTAIAGKYPLDRGASDEVAIEDFTRFFGPGGLMESFFNKHLEPYVDKLQTPWALKAVGGGLNISSAALAQFQKAETIRQVFFAGGGATPSISFQIKPQTMDKSIGRATLRIEGQVVRYSHGPTRAQTIKWPGPNPNNATLETTTTDGVSKRPLSEDGPWAGIRLIERAQISKTGATSFTLQFDADGRSLEFELRTNSVRNPFRLEALASFRCPEGF